MIYFIGGSPRTGKTIVANALAKKIGARVCSTDDLEVVVSSQMTENELAQAFPKSVIRKATNQSNDEMYGKYSSEEIVDAYLQQGTAVHETIIDQIDNEQAKDIIVEGYHVTPEFVDSLEEKYNVRSIFLGREDLNDIEQSIRKGQDDDWVNSKTDDEYTFGKIAAMIHLFSYRVKKSAEEFDKDYFTMDGDFDKNCETVINHLTEK